MKSVLEREVAQTFARDLFKLFYLLIKKFFIAWITLILGVQMWIRCWLIYLEFHLRSFYHFWDCIHILTLMHSFSTKRAAALLPQFSYSQNFWYEVNHSGLLYYPILWMFIFLFWQNTGSVSFVLLQWIFIPSHLQYDLPFLNVLLGYCKPLHYCKLIIHEGDWVSQWPLNKLYSPSLEQRTDRI